MSGFPPKVARLVFEVRDNSSCFRCGIGLRWEDRGIGWSLHHREPRGMGGARSSHVNQPSNAVTLCGSGTTGCHGWVESHRAEAEAAGYLVSRHGVDRPVHVPIEHGGQLVWLTDWASIVPVGEEVKF